MKKKKETKNKTKPKPNKDWEQREQGERKSLVEAECPSGEDETYPHLSTL